MGVSGFAACIKETDGVLASGLKGKEVHVDALSLYAGFIMARSFSTFSKAQKTVHPQEASSSAPVSTSEPVSSASSFLPGTSGPAPTSSPMSPSFVSLPTSSSAASRQSTKRPVSSEEGNPSKRHRATPTSMYGHIATQIDKILSKHMDKASTTLHWDGKPSEQKSAERRRRQEDLDKKLTKLQEDVAQAVNKKSAVPSRLYQLCRRLFRPSADILDDIKSELARLGWRVCTCDFQADTHIAQICQGHEVEVVSGDSDLFVYEGINHITMPVGKNHELTTFQKSDVLSLLNLPSDRHLLLACLLTRNDYNEGIRGLGLKRNAAIVRGFDLDPKMELDQVITKAIEKYLNTIKDPRGKTIKDFKNAISAFASLKEVWSPDAAPSAQTQDRIAMILMTLENHKSKRRLRGSQQQQQQQQHADQLQLQHPPGHKRKRKKRRRRTLKKRQRQSKWRRSKFKSRNADQNARYTSHVVKDTSDNAPKVQADVLRNLAVEEPRAAKPKAADYNNKLITPSPSKPSNKPIKLGNSAQGDGAAALKTLYQKTFQTATLTLGSLGGCLRRATDMTEEEAKLVAGRLESAVDILARTKMLVYKCLELFLISHLHDEASMDLDPSENGSNDADPLDIILDRKHGATVVRNLVALVLNGHSDSKKSPTSNQESIRSQELAQLTYDNLRGILTDLQAVKGSSTIPLGHPQQALAVEIHSALRTHFARIPEIIVSKMKKIGWQDEVIPQLESDHLDDEDDEDMDMDEYDTGGTKRTFRLGHIRTWWLQFIRLPVESRPSFCPTSSFKSAFALLSESDVIPILWSPSCKAVKNIVEARIGSRKDVEAIAKNHYGMLFHQLFVGDREKIRDDPHKSQTSYGKRSTTMSNVSTSNLSSHGAEALRTFLVSWYTYLRQKKEASISSRPIPSPPKFPRPPDDQRHYALSNMLRTDGLQLHMLAFDLRRQRQSSKARSTIMDITKRFASRESIDTLFQERHHDAVVVGVDPGEVVSASFCAIDGQDSSKVSNLIVKRSALYSPALRFRSTLHEMKQSHAVAAMENNLQAYSFESVQEYNSALQQYNYVFKGLHDFYGSRKFKRIQWERKKATRAELDWAVNGALGMTDKSRPCLFVYGDGKFNTHTKLASLHSSFKGFFYTKATSLGHTVVSANEYYTSTKCPSCAARGQDSRLAKPTMRSCVCLNPKCQRWVHRDSIGAHNLALIGRTWLDQMRRPAALCRPAA